MNKIKIIKKFKAYFIRFRIHKILGFTSDYLIYLGYLLKLSKWIDNNKGKLKYNDFYNSEVVHKNRIQLYDVFARESKMKEIAINYLEFGVGRGNSLRWWTKNNINPQSVFWGFDTYEGLPEKYGTYDIGVFSLDGNFPDIPDSRINFVKGLFQDTLLVTIHKIDFKKKLVIHIDGDLYSSALFSLCALYPYLKKGDIIIFDEFVVPLHEFKAFDDFIKSFYLKLEPIGAINNYLQMIFKIIDIRNVSSHNKK
jgi:O-methyltransferase